MTLVAKTVAGSQDNQSKGKRPRAPVACYRCHRKKVRCNGTRPMCARCDATNAECTYPTSRRTRSNQPTFVDPFIENISRLEARIHIIESNLAKQRALLMSYTQKNRCLGEWSSDPVSGRRRWRSKSEKSVPTDRGSSTAEPFAYTLFPKPMESDWVKRAIEPKSDELIRPSFSSPLPSMPLPSCSSSSSSSSSSSLALPAIASTFPLHPSGPPSDHGLYTMMEDIMFNYPYSASVPSNSSLLPMCPLSSDLYNNPLRPSSWEYGINTEHAVWHC